MTEIVKETWLERAVRSAVTEFKFGEIIPRDWIEEHMEVLWPEGLNRDQYKRIALTLLSRFEEFRRVMLYEHKRALRSVGSGEYQIVPPDEQHQFAIDQLHRGISRECNKALNVIDNTRTDLLSADAAKSRDEAVAKISAFEAMSRKRLS